MKSILLWMGTGRGRLAAALTLFAVVWALERLPVVRTWLDGRPLAKRMAAIALTILPAAAAGLWAGLPLGDVWQTALTALLVATGANTILPKLAFGLPPAPGSVSPSALRKTGALLVFLLAGCQPPVMLPPVDDCARRWHECAVMAASKPDYLACRARVDAACLDGLPTGAAPSVSASAGGAP